MGLSPLMPPCYQQGGLGTAWLQSLLPGRSMSSSTLGLPNAFRAQQLPDPGSDCPTGGPGEACVTLSNVALPRQPPSLLACPSPASPLPPLEVQEIRARDRSRGRREPCPAKGYPPVLTWGAGAWRCEYGWILPFGESLARGVPKQSSSGLSFIN